MYNCKICKKPVPYTSGKGGPQSYHRECRQFVTVHQIPDNYDVRQHGLNPTVRAAIRILISQERRKRAMREALLESRDRRHAGKLQQT